MPTILQISDPHLMSQAEGTLKGVPTAKSLEIVLNRAREEVADPARVVVTGDLSHEHTVAGYELLQELLGDWFDRSLLIPGNHDDRQALRSVFKQVPGDGDADVWFRDELDGWHLLGLDSHAPGYVHGELSESMLTQLNAWLTEEPSRPALIFLHHPPMSVGTPWIDKIGLHNPAPLQQLVEGSPGVCGIFCGHIHHVFENKFAGVPFLSAPSVSFQFTPKTDSPQLDHLPPGFRVIELDASSFTSRVVRLEDMPFIPTND